MFAGSGASTPVAHVPESRSTAAPVACPSCHRRSRRRCSYPPRRTTPSRWTPAVRAFAGSDASTPIAHAPTSRSTAAPAVARSCPRSCRRRCSSLPRRTTPTQAWGRGSCRRLRAATPRRRRPRARRLGQQQQLSAARAVGVVADGGAVPAEAHATSWTLAYEFVPAFVGSGASTRSPTSPTSRSTAAPVRVPSCPCSCRRRCSSPPRRTAPTQGRRRRPGSCWRLRAASPQRRSPTRPRSRSTAAPEGCTSCRGSGRRRCSCPPTRTTANRGLRPGSVRRSRGGSPRRQSPKPRAHPRSRPTARRKPWPRERPA